MSVKGKPNSFKSRAKGSIDITIRNPQELSNFLHQGGFQRQHISSLVCQCFDPTFIFNSIYHNVARLVNRKIVKSVPHTMPMTYKVKKEHYPILEKLRRLFFETQTLTAHRYLLLQNTKLSNLRNYLLWFSDGSINYSTSCIYLDSCDINSNRVHTSLINIMSRLSEDTLIAKTEESIPAKEMHGLLLCASNMVQTI